MPGIIWQFTLVFIREFPCSGYPVTNRLCDLLGVIDVHDKPGSSIGEQTEIRTRFLPDILIPVSVLHSFFFDKLVRR